MKNVLVSLTVLGIASVSSYSSGAILAYDDASDAAYTMGGSFENLNGGFGWSEWYPIYGAPQSGIGERNLIIGSSANNGPAPSPHIDVNGQAFRFRATYGTSIAERRLLQGQTGPARLSVDMDFGSPELSGSGSFEMSEDSGASFFSVEALAIGTNNRRLVMNTNLGTFDTGFDPRNGTFRIEMTMDGLGAGHLKVIRLSDMASVSTTGSFSNLELVYIFQRGNYTSAAGDLYVNSLKLETVPEPATLAALGVGAAALIRRRKKA